MERKVAAIVAIVIVIVVVGASLAVLIPRLEGTSVTTPSVYSNTKLASTGSQVSFTATNSNNLKGVSNVTWNFGDGTTGYGANVTHVYNNPGNYLVEVVLHGSSGTVSNVKALYSVTVQKNTAGVSRSVLGEQTVPVILFNATEYPNEPVFNASQNVTVNSSYLEPPTAANWSITGYNWSLNGQTGTGKDFNFSLKNTGLYPLYLNMTTGNGTANQTSTSVQSIFIETSGMDASVLKASGKVVNPGIINAAEVVPGGFYSLDPQIDWETVGMEPIRNVYQGLVAYNGTSTTSFLPVLATNIPTVSNGEVTSNGLNWTFHIRTNASFANGDSVTAFDVYFSMVRELLFTTGSPGTGGYTLAQATLPGFATGTPGFNSYANITKAITYSNQSQTVTFHLFAPVPYFLALLADTPSSVLDYNWVAAHGSPLTFTAQGFLNYEKQSFANDYNTYIQFHAMGSGPFVVSSVQPGESITLVPNKYYSAPAQGFPASNYTVVINYVKEASTAALMLQSGKADVVSSFPASSLGDVLPLVSAGTANAYTFSTFSNYFYPFNFNVNETMLHNLGTGYTVPQYYFSNLSVRQAFSDAFNYSEFISSILGNNKFHMDLGSSYVGVLPTGMLGAKPYSQWLNAPTYDLAKATSLLKNAGLYDIKVNIPVPVSSGDTTNYASVSMWAQAMHSVDPNIQMTPIYLPFNQIIAYSAAGSNPMPIYSLGWGTSIADPINMIPPIFAAGGFYLSADGVSSPSFLTTIGHSNQAHQFMQLDNLSNKAGINTNAANRTIQYQQANQIGINLSLYVYTYVASGLWLYKPYVKGVLNEENPVVGGEADTLFCYLSK